MIKNLQLNFLFRKTVAVSVYNSIHTHNVLSRSFRRNHKPHPIPDEPGVRHRRDILKIDSDYPDEVFEEHELDDDFDMMKLDKAYDLDARDRKKFNERVRLKITAKKFFSPPPQPSMLTYNERLCIKYLHKQDPVQWDLKTLSESFPVTPSIIKKILKSNHKLTPEQIKKMDSNVQKNWALLAEGKLNADPDVLEHFKRFINRREVLLEQIKNETFYLPEIKPEPVWNQGEMTSIISKYEKEIEHLVEGNNVKSLPDESDNINSEKKNKSSRDLVYEQIKAESQSESRMKDSFKFGKMINSLRKNTTFDEYENTILQKAETGKKLDVAEKAILENKLGITKESSNHVKMQQVKHRSFNEHENINDFNINWSRGTETKELPSDYDEFNEKKMKNRERPGKRVLEKCTEVLLEYAPPDENTHSGNETDVWNILQKVENKSEEREVEKLENEELEKLKEKKKEIDFSDPERQAREKAYYDKEVLDIQDTPFWNNNRTSKEKAMAELEKRNHDQPVVDEDVVEKPYMFALNNDPYPEKIQIPKHKRKSGATYKVKDCYYDDDGEFLYRVPGMIK